MAWINIADRGAVNDHVPPAKVQALAKRRAPDAAGRPAIIPRLAEASRRVDT
jgi:hypothetical protein